MGRQIYRNDRSTHDKLETKLPAIREYVTCLLITAPKMKALAKPFRDFFDWSVKITLEEGGIKQNMRRGKHYFKEEYPDEVHYAMYHPYDDRYSCLVPDEFYKWIDDKKRAALKEYDEWAEKRKIVPFDDEDDDNEP